MANEFARIDRVLDEVLVQLGEIVLTMASPRVTRTGEERQALARSVNQYAICAASSDDPRVKELRARLEDSLKPKLLLVISKESMSEASRRSSAVACRTAPSKMIRFSYPGSQHAHRVIQG
jgi:hypothetical protein